jgi:probable selenium-dependent hydroxylase accessory protein YqeC
MTCMRLCEALDIRPGQAVAFVGAGGKTTAIWRVQAELSAQGAPVVYVTTTKMMEPVLPSGGALYLALRPDATRMAGLLERAPRLVLAARRPKEPVTPHADHPVPSRPFKLDGLPPETLDDLIGRLPGVTWLIEADGAKGCGLKIHAEHEPVVPSSVTTAVVMAHLDVLGSPLDGTTAHRVDDAIRLLGVPMGTPITPALFAHVLCHATSRKGVPEGARIVLALTQRSATLHPDAHALAGLLRKTYRHIVFVALRSESPVLAVLSP